MAESENMVYEINFDTGKIEDGLEDLAGGLGALETAIGKMDQSISKGFSSGMRLLQGVEAETKKISALTKESIKTLTDIIRENTSSIVNEISKVLKTVDRLTGEQQHATQVDAFFKAAEFIAKIPGGGNSTNTTTAKSGASGPMSVPNAPLGLPAPKGDGDGTAIDGLVSGTMQNLADKLPFDTAAMAESIATLTKSTAAWLADTAAKAGNTVATWAQVAATTAWQAICTAATAVTTAFGAAMSFLASPIGIVIAAVAALIAIIVLLVKNWDTVKATAISVWEAIKEAFGNAWEWFQNTVLDPLANGFKGMVNGIIGFINGMIAGVVNGINAIIGLLNKIKFDIPEWVPGLGGQTFGFSLTPLTAPQIPYLAQGAVLPANKPFLAVVGDQRHGTNIEAPLATIQEAVALVMNDQVAAMMAGFEATVEEVRLLRQMVSGIEIGDSTIGQAARRYERKMAVVTGGRY